MIVDLSYLYSKRFGVGDYFGVEKDAAFVELKETSVAMASRFQAVAGDTQKTSALFVEVLPSIIVDHDLWKDEAHKCTAEEVTVLIAGRAELCIEIMGRYIREVLFSHGRTSAGNS